MEATFVRLRRASIHMNAFSCPWGPSRSTQHISIGFLEPLPLSASVRRRTIVSRRRTIGGRGACTYQIRQVEAPRLLSFQNNPAKEFTPDIPNSPALQDTPINSYGTSPAHTPTPPPNPQSSTSTPTHSPPQYDPATSPPRAAHPGA